jgi:EAL domain-containing protein (putative c-di-GMP-specific phosphodiesterase class I)
VTQRGRLSNNNIGDAVAPVGTAARRDRLRESGCRYGLGYPFARPPAASDLDAWLAGEPAQVARG